MSIILHEDRRSATHVRYYVGKAEDRPMLIPEEVEKSMVFVGCKQNDPDEPYRFCGTAFFVKCVLNP